MKEEEIHLVKRVSKELGLTYKEFGEKIGYTEGGLKNLIFKNQVTKHLQKSIELYLENIELKKEIKETEALREILKSFIMKS